MPDCNYCISLNMSEDKQEDNSKPHICKHYGKRVFHRTQKLFHSSYLYPCKECENDGYYNYGIE